MKTCYHARQALRNKSPEEPGDEGKGEGKQPSPGQPPQEFISWVVQQAAKRESADGGRDDVECCIDSAVLRG